MTPSGNFIFVQENPSCFLLILQDSHSLTHSLICLLHSYSYIILSLTLVLFVSHYPIPTVIHLLYIYVSDIFFRTSLQLSMSLSFIFYFLNSSPCLLLSSLPSISLLCISLHYLSRKIRTLLYVKGLTERSEPHKATTYALGGLVKQEER